MVILEIYVHLVRVNVRLVPLIKLAQVVILIIFLNKLYVIHNVHRYMIPLDGNVLIYVMAFNWDNTAIQIAQLDHYNKENYAKMHAMMDIST